MIKKLFSIAFCLCTSAMAFAQPSVDVEASRALPFLEVNPDVRTAAMGEANMGNTKGMYLYSNPSAMLYNGEEIYAGYSFAMFPKVGEGRTMMHSANAAYKFHSNHAVMIGARYFALPDIFNYDPSGNKLDAMKAHDMSIDAAYAIRFAKNFSAFIGGSFIQSKYSTSANTGGVSLGAYYNSVNNNNFNYSIGIDLKNLGADVKYDGSNDAYKLPTSVGVGGNLACKVAEDHTIGAAVSARYFILPSEAAEFTVGVGAEYDFMNMLAVRAGYHVGDKNNYFTAGLGFRYDYVGIDAAYSIASVKEFNLLRIGLNLYF